ncbi:hypothetical protein L6452_08413 [Arctium lappa]|uniref:Uncharacterized protein n=1 Tax=Arctium lappa TaxID=4217 RepID=A0ACB9DI14_ARCLA|nr:hypothetical protein L6452_08413 [Arctium lappa]
MHGTPVEQRMDTGLQQGRTQVFSKEGHRSSARHVIDTILADGVDHLGMLGFRLRRLSSIRFERCTPSLSSSADL